jgi:hypothetical protein
VSSIVIPFLRVAEFRASRIEAIPDSKDDARFVLQSSLLAPTQNGSEHPVRSAHSIRVSERLTRLKTG